MAAPSPSRSGRRRTLAALIALWLAWLAPPALRAESQPEFQVIVHAKNPVHSLRREFVADAFLKKGVDWEHAETIRPVDQRADTAVRRAFSRSVLKRTVAAVRNYWTQRIFSGREVPPPEVESDEAVVGFVAKNEGAIGYVSSDAKLAGVKIVPVH